MLDLKGRNCSLTIGGKKVKGSTATITTTPMPPFHTRSHNNLNKVGVEVFEKQQAEYNQRLEGIWSGGG